jgi:hypothetical protein
VDVSTGSSSPIVERRSSNTKAEQKGSYLLESPASLQAIPSSRKSQNSSSSKTDALALQDLQYKRKQPTKLHPLDDPMLHYFENWPSQAAADHHHTSNASSDTHLPDLLRAMVQEVEAKLIKLTMKFPHEHRNVSKPRKRGDPTPQLLNTYRQVLKLPPTTTPAATAAVEAVSEGPSDVVLVGSREHVGSETTVVTEQIEPFTASSRQLVVSPQQPVPTRQETPLVPSASQHDGRVSSRDRAVDEQHSPTLSPAGAMRKRKSSTMTRTAEDIYRTGRMAIFEGALRDFASRFVTYQPFLLWVLDEQRAFVEYCHQHVVTPEMRMQFERDVRAELEAEFADERARLNFSLNETKTKLDEMTRQYHQLKQFSQSSEHIIAEKVKIIQARDAEIVQNNEGRQALLSHIHRMEKELYAHKDALEGPEAIISALRKDLRTQEDRVAHTTRQLDEAKTEIAVQKVRLERLEELVKDRKSRTGGTVAKAEMLVLKKQQIELLELNATLEAKLIKLRNAMKNMMEDLQRVKGGQPTTPRPPWHLADDIFPQAATTAQRVHLAMREYRLMVEKNRVLERSVEDTRRLFALRQRGEDNDEHEYITPQMRQAFFYKLGFESSVPSFLRGVGRAVNLHFTCDQVEGFCRMLFLHRETQKGYLSAESLFESFCAKTAPSNITVHDFVYSLFYGMHWFAFEPLIGLMRAHLLGRVDDTVLSHLDDVIFGCKRFFYVAATESSPQEGGGGGGSEGATGSANSPRQQGTTPPTSMEEIRRKSAINLLAGLNKDGTAPADPAAEKIHRVSMTITEKPVPIYKSEVLPLVADFFANREEENIKRLVTQMALDYPGVLVDIKGLFKYNATKRRFTNFVEEILRQELALREELVEEYVATVQQLAGSSPEGHVTPQGVAQALWNAVPPGVPPGPTPHDARRQQQQQWATRRRAAAAPAVAADDGCGPEPHRGARRGRAAGAAAAQCCWLCRGACRVQGTDARITCHAAAVPDAVCAAADVVGPSRLCSDDVDDDFLLAVADAHSSSLATTVPSSGTAASLNRRWTASRSWRSSTPVGARTSRTWTSAARRCVCCTRTTAQPDGCRTAPRHTAGSAARQRLQSSHGCVSVCALPFGVGCLLGLRHWERGAVGLPPPAGAECVWQRQDHDAAAVCATTAGTECGRSVSALNDAALADATGLVSLSACGNRAITTVEPFGASLRRLDASYSMIGDAGLVTATNLVYLDASCNDNIRSLAPFSASLLELDASGFCQARSMMPHCPQQRT